MCNTVEIVLKSRLPRFVLLNITWPLLKSHLNLVLGKGKGKGRKKKKRRKEGGKKGGEGGRKGSLFILGQKGLQRKLCPLEDSRSHDTRGR